MDFGRPMSLSMIMVMAPVAYMPAATMNRTATVSMPWLLNPFNSSWVGASFRVIAAVSAPTNMAGAGIFVLTSRTNSTSNRASVR